MATLAKVFKHQTDQCENLDNTTAGLAKDIEDYITANGGTVHNDTNLNVTSWSVGVNVYTLVVIGNDS
tara:strand:+ start:1663 stop:1866 length:204 start_codon:yes stop_codon:yes gene_type:complete